MAPPALPVTKLGKTAIIPKEGQQYLQDTIVLTDQAVAVPSGIYGRIAPRSVLPAKHHADLSGNVKIVLFNHGNLDIHVWKGDRIAQLLLGRIRHLQFWSLPNCPWPTTVQKALDLQKWKYQMPEDMSLPLPPFPQMG